jgi:hypothetical protein
MAIIRSALTFLMIVAFAGAIVLVGARDMRRSLAKHSDEQKTHAQELIRMLRGDSLLQKGEGRYLHPESLPQRTGGSVLPATDKQRMKGLLQKLIGFADDSSDEGTKSK